MLRLMQCLGVVCGSVEVRVGGGVTSRERNGAVFPVLHL